MADSAFPWDLTTDFVDPGLVDPTAPFSVGDVGGITDLGIAGTDTAGGSVDTMTTFDQTNIDVGGGQLILADGSQVDTAFDGSQSWTSADGTTYPDVTVSPDGSIVQFADGWIMDISTGQIYSNTGDLMFDPASSSAANNGAGSINPPGAGQSLLSKIGKVAGGFAPSGATGQPGKPGQSGAVNASSAATQIGQLLAKFGSGMTSLLSGGAKKVPVNQQTVGQVATANLGGSAGFAPLLVIGGFGLLLVLTMKGSN